MPCFKLKAKITSLIVSAAMLFSFIPTLADSGEAVNRQYVIAQFINAVGEESFAYPAADISSFTDGSESDFPHEMGLAVANGIITGYEDNTLRPQAPISRLEAMVILSRCMPSLTPVREDTVFYDVPDWAAEDISRLYTAGLLNGYGNGLMGSSDPITADQVALLKERIIEGASAPDPADDFYGSVNYDYLTSVKLKEGSLSASLMDDASDKTDKILEEISADLLNRYDSLVSSGANTPEVQAAKLYKLALEFDKSGETDISALSEDLSRIMSIGDASQVGGLNGELILKCLAPIMFDFSVYYKDYEPISGVYVDFVGSGMDSGYWLEGGSAALESYRIYAEKVLSLTGLFADPHTASAKAAEFTRSVEMAAKSYTEVVRTGMEEDDSPDEDYFFDRDDLAERYKSYGFSAETNPVLAAFGKIADESFMRTAVFAISDIKEIDRAVELMAEADSETLQAVCVINYLRGFMTFLPRPYRDALSEFNASFLGGGEITSSESYATSVAEWVYEPYFEEEYLRRRNDLDIDGVTEMINEILDTFKLKFLESDVISNATAAKAVTKLKKMKARVCQQAHKFQEDSDFCYNVPEGASVPQIGMELYQSMGGGLFAIYHSVSYSLPCYTVNASYNIYTNCVDIYAGIMEEPLYSADLSPEEKLGSLGFTIAHEISHAFDETGSYYDSYGNYSEWWKEADYETYNKNAAKLASLVDKYVGPYSTNVDGRLTSNENIADIMAMDCVITLAKNKGMDLDKIFRSYAKSWAQVINPGYAKYCSRYDTHSPACVRVNCVLSNFEEFHDLYGVTEENKMYRAPEDRVKFI